MAAIIVEIPPLSEKPDNAQLGKVIVAASQSIVATHQCLDELRIEFDEYRKIQSTYHLENKKNIKKIQNQITQGNRSRKGIEVTVKKLTDDLAKLTQQKSILSMSQVELAWKAATLIGIVTGLWKFIGFSWPYFWGWIGALNTLYSHG